jgi:tripartite-type tricarboxylate transporter receptor subunit TctC
MSIEKVQYLNCEITGVLREPEIVAAFHVIAIDPSPGSSEEFGAYIATQHALWR